MKTLFGKTTFVIFVIVLSITSINAEVMWKTSLGYLGNIPGAFLGMNLSGYRYEGVGYHLDVKSNLGGRQGRDNYYESISVGEFDDPLKADSKSYLIFDVGITRKLFGGLYVMGGVGLVLYDEYLKYKDPLGILGDSSNEYWICDDDEGYIGVNVTGALTYIIDTKNSPDISVTVGGDLDPPGVIAGIGIVF
jgi:hypothetical protein